MKIRLLAVALSVMSALGASAELPIEYDASLIGNVSSNSDFAPYFISSNAHGIITQSKSGYLRLSGIHRMDSTKRFSYGFGADLLAGASTSVEYQRVSSDGLTFVANSQRPANFWVQQLYGELKYRSLFLTLGLKEHESPLFNTKLSSGDFVESGNARPIPEARIGFIDFQNIPFTNGWAQIQGEYSIGKTTDSDWLRNHYNYNDMFVTTGVGFSYKRLLFRSNPSKPFSFTIGMQAATQFGGTTKKYLKNELVSEHTEKVTFKSLLHTIIPGSGSSPGNDVYYDGNWIGAWNALARYRLHNGSELKAYVQFPWEDGSGIGKLNGWDGVYGLEYKNSRPWWIDGAVVEYIDFRNQSGPIHWAPDLNPNTPEEVKGGACTGADDYYNNFQYNSYQYYGMSIGTPFIKSTIYNKDGFLRCSDNRVQGFHIGVTGALLPTLRYRCLVSYRKSLGTPFLPSLEKLYDTSAMIEAIYKFEKVKGLTAKLQLAFDKGSLYSDNFGGLITISYRGLLKL